MKKRFICNYCKKTRTCPNYKPNDILYMNGCDIFEPKDGINLSKLGYDKEIIKDDDGIYTVY